MMVGKYEQNRSIDRALFTPRTTKLKCKQASEQRDTRCEEITHSKWFVVRDSLFAKLHIHTHSPNGTKLNDNDKSKSDWNHGTQSARVREREKERVQKSSSHVILILCFHFPTENVYYIIIIIILCFCVAFRARSLIRLCRVCLVILLLFVLFISHCLVFSFFKTLLPRAHSTIIITCNSCFGIAMNRLKICVADTRFALL